TQAAPPQRIVDDIDAGREYLSAALLAQEAALAGNRAAVGGAGKMADQGAGDTPVEHHRDAARRHLAWIEALDGPLSGASPDFLRALQVRGMQHRRVIVVRFHAG